MSKNTDMEFVNTWFLMNIPALPVFLLPTYLLFVLKIGPNYMRNKKPYQLKNVITAYNIMQVFFSLYLVYVCGRMIISHGLISTTCGMETKNSREGVALGMYYYLLAKITELLDTVFFVLRKKDRQITFLHVYHHALMVVVYWTTLKYEPTVHVLFLASLNSFVHVIMYAYYGLSSFPQLAKYLWWKKYITTLQLVQFVAIMTHFALTIFISDCKPSNVLSATVLGNCLLFIYLFGMFYVNNYIKRNSKVISKGENDHITQNANDKRQAVVIMVRNKHL